MKLTITYECLIFIVALGISLSAFAENPVEKCSKSSNTIELASCLEKSQEELDASLNKTYQHFLETLGQMEKDSLADMPKGLLVHGLRDAERAWIKYRDKSCDFEANFFASNPN